MTFKHITSRDNPKFKQLKRLAESSRERRQTGQTLLDGVHLLSSYIQHYGAPELLLIAKGESNREVTDFIQMQQDLPSLMMPALMFSELSPVASPSGVMALINIPSVAVPETAQFVLLLEDIQDPGNLGSMLRSALAAEVDAVYLSTGCCDVWSPKALRGGQGAQLFLPLIERADLLQVADDFSGQVLATSMQGVSIFNSDMRGACALVMGNEGAGVSPALLQKAHAQVAIPMQANVESLNVAAACAVCLFERVRQRQLGEQA
jgi:TrmH family RNA methyltransferase